MMTSQNNKYTKIQNNTIGQQDQHSSIKKHPKKYQYQPYH